MAWTREQMAARAAQELRDGYYVNLGIGIPTLVANYIPPGMNVVLQSRERHARHRAVPLRGRGRSRSHQCRQADRHRAADLGYFTRADSFAMIRGGHIDICHARRHGGRGERRPRQLDDPRQDGQGHGRRDGSRRPACKRVVVVMEHAAKGEPKLKKRCTLPLTGAGVVDMVITDLAVFTLDRHGGGLTLIELAPDVTLDDLKAKTDANFKVANTLVAVAPAGLPLRQARPRRAKLRTETRCGARPRRSTFRSSSWSPRRRAHRTSHGFPVSSPSAACCRRVVRRAYPRA